MDIRTYLKRAAAEISDRALAAVLSAIQLVIRVSRIESYLSRLS